MTLTRSMSETTRDMLAVLPVLSELRPLSLAERRRIDALLHEGESQAAMIAGARRDEDGEAFYSAMLCFAAALNRRTARLRMRKAELVEQLQHMNRLKQWRRGIQNTVSFK